MKSNVYCFFTVFLFVLLSICPSSAADYISLENKKGNKMRVTILRIVGDKVAIKRAKDGKEFIISPDQLSKESSEKLKMKIKNFKEAMPPLDIEVVISKRRKADEGSSYMKAMTITGKVTVKNKDNNATCPECVAHIIFFGQDQSETKQYQILSNQEFKITPTIKGAVFSSAPFVAKYDSDNKGEGNIGGSKYVGYLVVLRDKDGKVYQTKTIYSLVKKALNFDPKMADTLTKLTVNTILNDKLKKPKPKPLFR